MRFSRALTIDQLKYLLDHVNLTNQEIADQLGVSKAIVASYKSRARKAGVKIPFQKRLGTTITDDIKKLAKPITTSSSSSSSSTSTLHPV